MKPPSESFEVAAFRSLFVDAPAQEAAHLACTASALQALVLYLCSTDAAAVKFLAFSAPYRRIATRSRLARSRFAISAPV